MPKYNYIEKDTQGEFFNPISSTVKVNPDCNCNNKPSSSGDENYERWRWLIDNWDKMSFKERLALFYPYMHYVNTRDNYKKDFDERFQSEMIETGYKTCRMFDKLKFDPDGQGIPNMIMVFKPIIIEQIPDVETRNKVITWANNMKLINCVSCMTNKNNN